MTRIFSLLSLVCLFLMAEQAQAQIQQYSVLVGGSITGTYYQGKLPSNTPGVNPNFTTFEVNLNPKGGVFLWQQFAVGGALEYNFYNRVPKAGNAVKEVEWVVGPFVRYYLPNRIFAEGFLGIGIRNVNDNEKSDVLKGTVGVGYAFFLNEKIALEPMVRYVNYSREITQGVREKRNGAQLAVGLQIYLFHDKMILYR